MTYTVLLYVAVEAGLENAKMVFAELNCHVLTNDALSNDTKVNDLVTLTLTFVLK